MFAVIDSACLLCMLGTLPCLFRQLVSVVHAYLAGGGITCYRVEGGGEACGVVSLGLRGIVERAEAFRL